MQILTFGHCSCSVENLLLTTVCCTLYKVKTQYNVPISSIDTSNKHQISDPHGIRLCEHNYIWYGRYCIEEHWLFANVFQESTRVKGSNLQVIWREGKTIMHNGYLLSDIKYCIFALNKHKQVLSYLKNSDCYNYELENTRASIRYGVCLFSKKNIKIVWKIICFNWYVILQIFKITMFLWRYNMSLKVNLLFLTCFRCKCTQMES